MPRGKEPWRRERILRDLLPEIQGEKCLGPYPESTWEKVEKALQGKERELKIVAYTDGASRGNPGQAGIGVFLLEAGGEPIGEIARYIGKRTNNEAEYEALIAAVRRATEFGATELTIRTDSELVARHITGEYRVKSPKLRPLYQEAIRLLRQIPRWKIESIPRDQNREADRLANRGIDENQDPG